MSKDKKFDPSSYFTKGEGLSDEEFDRIMDIKPTIDSGADVCEWEHDGEEDFKTSCGEMVDDTKEVTKRGLNQFIYCPYCKRDITIKGE